MMDEALGVIVRLMDDTEPFTHVSDWFELHEAVLQLRPFQRPRPPIAVTSMESPAGMVLAGKHGCGVLSLSVAKAGGGPVALREQWRIAEESAGRHGNEVRRQDWRLAVPIHLAPTRQEALDDAREGAAAYLLDYAEATTGRPSPVPGPRGKVIDQMVERGSWIVGTPDDCVAAIERLWEISGGFGAVLAWAHEWAPREKVLQSYELLARYVAPRFQGSLAGIERSNADARARAEHIHRTRSDATEAARRSYREGRGG
jgi:limonene 1,2-monooxygenase